MAESEDADNKDLKNRKRLVFQALGLFIWPLITVFITVIALYGDRMSTLKVSTVERERLLLKAATSLLTTESVTVGADLMFLRDHIIASHREDLAHNPGQLITDLFDRLVANNPNYKRLRLIGLDGQEIAGVPGNPARNQAGTAVSGADRLAGHDHDMVPIGVAGEIDISPARLVAAGDMDRRSGLAFRFDMKVDGDGDHAGFIISLDCVFSDIVPLIAQSDSGALTRLHLISEAGRSAIRAGSADPGTNQAGDGEWPANSAIADVIGSIAGSEAGYRFIKGGLFTFQRFVLLPLPSSMNEPSGAELPAAPQPGERPGWLAVAEIPASYFAGKKYDYGMFLVILAVTLLVPSLVACVFWARARLTVEQEELRRNQARQELLGRLETEVKDRTRELDDRNLQLNAEIAERLGAEIRLRQSNELLSGMIESIDGIIYVADFDSHEILFANQYLMDLFGFDLVGKKCWQFIHSSKDGPCLFCTNGHLVDNEGEPTEPFHWEYQNPFNKKWYAATDRAIRWSNGKYVKLEIAIDITEQKRMQHFLQEARRQAELAKGIRSRFVALVAHDLKSPFYSITQMLQRILERETFTHRVHRQFLENIVKNGHRMLQMIDNLLSIDRFETSDVKLEKTFFDVCEMAEEVIQNFGAMAFEKGLRLSNQIPAGRQIYADKYLYFVVLNNLVSNAIKFSNPGGRINLFVPKAEAPMTVAVEDNGKGMEQDYIDNLFKEDIKTSSIGTGGESGSGLGLIFCQNIMKAHHGTLVVESELGRGSRFTINLPDCIALERGGTEADQADEPPGPA